MLEFWDSSWEPSGRYTGISNRRGGLPSIKSQISSQPSCELVLMDGQISSPSETLAAKRGASILIDTDEEDSPAPRKRPKTRRNKDHSDSTSEDFPVNSDHTSFD